MSTAAVPLVFGSTRQHDVPIGPTLSLLHDTRQMSRAAVSGKARKMLRDSILDWHFPTRRQMRWNRLCVLTNNPADAIPVHAGAGACENYETSANPLVSLPLARNPGIVTLT